MNLPIRSMTPKFITMEGLRQAKQANNIQCATTTCTISVNVNVNGDIAWRMAHRQNR